MLTSATSKWGWNREERAALLRLRTRPESPEGTWRELTGDRNFKYGIAREREKINLGKALNLGTTRPFPEGRTEQIPEKS